MINGSLLLRTAGRSSFDPSARDRLGSGIFPDVSRSSLDASGITDCWEAGDLCEAVAAVRRIDVFAVHAVTVMPLRDVKVRLANSEVAVTEIYLRPPHRSRRALLTHRAPTLDGGRSGRRHHGLRPGIGRIEVDDVPVSCRSA